MWLFCLPLGPCSSYWVASPRLGVRIWAWSYCHLMYLVPSKFLRLGHQAVTVAGCLFYNLSNRMACTAATTVSGVDEQSLHITECRVENKPLGAGRKLPSSENHDRPHSLTPSATGQRVCVAVAFRTHSAFLTWRPSVLVFRGSRHTVRDCADCAPSHRADQCPRVTVQRASPAFI